MLSAGGRWRGRCLLGAVPTLEAWNRSAFLPSPGAPTDSEERDLAEIDAAIELVRQGMAARVRLVGLRRPETVAGAGLAHAQASDVAVQRRPRSRWRGRADHRASRARATVEPSTPRPADGAERAAISGRRPADRRVRVDAATSPYFRYAGPGTVTARPAANAPTQPIGRMAARGRRILFGRPLASDEEAEERLSDPKALAVFSSDNLTSVAYATEAIMFTLLAAGTAAFWLDHADLDPDRRRSSAIIVISYRQTIRAYPNGGGSYIVAARTSGSWPGSSPPRPCWSTTS